MDKAAFVETFAIHNRINLYLLSFIEEAALSAIPASKGRTLGEQFAHIHNVRLMWLNAAKPELMDGLVKYEKGSTLSKEILTNWLIESGNAIENLLASSYESRKVKGFKPNVMVFLGYLIAHEAHHRGQIMLILKQAGYKIDKKMQFGLWEWGVR